MRTACHLQVFDLGLFTLAILLWPALTLSMLGKHFQQTTFWNISPENRIWNFMQIQFAWNFKSYFPGKIRKISSMSKWQKIYQVYPVSVLLSFFFFFFFFFFFQEFGIIQNTWGQCNWNMKHFCLWEKKKSKRFGRCWFCFRCSKGYYHLSLDSASYPQLHSPAPAPRNPSRRPLRMGFYCAHSWVSRNISMKSNSCSYHTGISHTMLTLSMQGKTISRRHFEIFS